MKRCRFILAVRLRWPQDVALDSEEMGVAGKLGLSSLIERLAPTGGKGAVGFQARLAADLIARMACRARRP